MRAFWGSPIVRSAMEQVPYDDKGAAIDRQAGRDTSARPGVRPFPVRARRSASSSPGSDIRAHPSARRGNWLGSLPGPSDLEAGGGERPHPFSNVLSPSSELRSGVRAAVGAFVLGLAMFGAWLTAPPILLPGAADVPDDLAIETAEGVVESSVKNPPGAPGGSRHVVRVETGAHAGRMVTVTLQAPTISMVAGTAPTHDPGDRVVLSYRAEEDPIRAREDPTSAPVDPAAEPFQIVDRVRTPWLWAGVALVAVVAGAVSGWQGIRAMVGLGVAAWMVWWIVVARILGGQDPVMVAIFGCIAIAVPSIVLTHGFGREAAVPLAGMAGSLAVAGAVSVVAVRAASLTGLGANEEIHLVHAALRGAIDTRGLLLASMLIGAVGGLVDVTVAQSAAVFEFADARLTRARDELFWRGMSVGRAHVVAAIHTLVLAYVGAALPMLLLLALYAPQLGDIWNREVIAAELLRAVTGIVGLAVAMPLTTFIAARVAPIHVVDAMPRSTR